METNETMMPYEEARNEKIQKLAEPYRSEDGNIDTVRLKKDIKTQRDLIQRMLALKDILCKWQAMICLGISSKTFTVPESIGTSEMYNFKEFNLDLENRIPIGALIKNPLFSGYEPKCKLWPINGALDIAASVIKAAIGKEENTITIDLGHIEKCTWFRREESGFFSDVADTDATCNWIHDDLMGLNLQLTKCIEEQLEKIYGLIDVCNVDPNLKDYDVRYYCDLKYILEEEAA